MFCFTYPRNTNVEPIRVSILAQTQYSVTGYGADLLDFVDFLKRHMGELVSRATRTQSNGPESHDFYQGHSLSSEVQSQLFFGLASKALGRNVRHEEFASVNLHDSIPSIDLRIPRWYWRELKARWDELDDSLGAAEFNAKRVELKVICDTVWALISFVDMLAFDKDNDKLTEIFLSVYMLLYLVAYVLDGASSVKETFTSLASTKLLKNRMLKNGWCEKRLNFLKTRKMPFPALYFLSSLQPPRIHAEDHSKCTSEKCLVSGKVVKHLHRTGECLCEDIVIPIDRVKDIVKSGGVPLVRITRSSLGIPELEAVPYTPSFKFIAISHIWADGQFGSHQGSLPRCQVRHVEEVLSSLPTLPHEWGLRETGRKYRGSQPGDIVVSSRAYEYFWLDSFCLPPADECPVLRSKAMKSVNFVYATASQTLVFDKGLQSLDAGRRPASLVHGGPPSYYSPRDENLLDVIAYIYASNWMGRAWTLLEGVLSRVIVVQLRGSLAYLRLLKPQHDREFGEISERWQYLVTRIPEHLRRSARNMLPRKLKIKTSVAGHLQGGPEALRAAVQNQIFAHMRESLNIDEHGDYARTPAGRAARFVKAHSLLQSRTATKANDIPIILMNMCCMNANAIVQGKSTGECMKQLFYGLESLPVELLFSDSARLGSCIVDAWIPSEIIPEIFWGIHTLKLGSEGFTFKTRRSTSVLKFYMLSFAHRPQHVRLLLPDDEDGEICKYNVEALQRSRDEQPAAPTTHHVWCIAFYQEAPGHGARFIVNRVVGNKYFLHFDCPLRLTKIDNAESDSYATQGPERECSAVSLNGDFIIERSHESQDWTISRPQNPGQYWRRVTSIGRFIYFATFLVELSLIKAKWGDVNSMSTLFYICQGVYNIVKLLLVKRSLGAFVHKAWRATYKPDYSPNGQWKWFWKVSNWQPPIYLEICSQWCLTLIFCAGFTPRSWWLLTFGSMHWPSEFWN